MNGRKHTAYHEAGHAICGAVLGIFPGGASIVARSDDGTSGRSLGMDDRASPFRKAVWSYAGHAAGVELLGVGTMGDRSARRHGADRDFAEARALLAGSAPRIRYAKARAVSIIRRYRATVERVADLLLTHRQLDGQIIDMLVAAQDLGDDGPILPALLERLRPAQNPHSRRVSRGQSSH